MAMATVAVIGLTPTVSPGTTLLAAQAPEAFYVRGSNVGYVPPDDEYAAWVDTVLTETVGAHQEAEKIDYPASFWPISNGYLTDPTWNTSVREGVAGLNTAVGNGGGAVIYGYSQGAVVASEYKAQHPGSGNTYVLVANLDRPNGGLLSRFSGVYLPILDFTFNGATPATGDTTYDIARQYDGWSDFPKYPLNLLATANALLGILYIHGNYDTEVSATDLDDPTKTDKQVDTATNTTYYLIHTDRLPLLMPFEGIVPDAVLDALDPPLRVLVELGYDRTDYGAATPATTTMPDVDPQKVFQDLVAATIKGVTVGLSEMGSGTQTSTSTTSAAAATTATGTASPASSTAKTTTSTTSATVSPTSPANTATTKPLASKTKAKSSGAAASDSTATQAKTASAAPSAGKTTSAKTSAGSGAHARSKAKSASS